VREKKGRTIEQEGNRGAKFVDEERWMREKRDEGGGVRKKKINQRGKKKAKKV